MDSTSAQTHCIIQDLITIPVYTFAVGASFHAANVWSNDMVLAEIHQTTVC